MRMTPGRSVIPMHLVLAGPPAAQGGDWTTCGGNDWNQRYSTLRQTDTSNVASAFVAIPGEEQNDSKTGKLLWQFNGGAGCNSAPMTFTHGGEQFVAVARGGNFQLTFPLGGAVLVFGLPKARK